MPEELGDVKIPRDKEMRQGSLESTGGCVIPRLGNILFVDSEAKLFFILKGFVQKSSA